MPPIDNEHTDKFYLNVERVIGLILNNPYYLESKRASALRERVMDLLKVSEPQAKRYISKAKKHITEYYSEDNDKNKKKAIMRYEGIIKRAQMSCDYRSEIEANKQLNILLGITKDPEENNQVQKIVIEQTIIDKRT